MLVYDCHNLQWSEPERIQEYIQAKSKIHHGSCCSVTEKKPRRHDIRKSNKKYLLKYFELAKIIQEPGKRPGTRVQCLMIFNNNQYFSKCWDKCNLEPGILALSCDFRNYKGLVSEGSFLYPTPLFILRSLRSP